MKIRILRAGHKASDESLFKSYNIPESSFPQHKGLTYAVISGVSEAEQNVIQSLSLTRELIPHDDSGFLFVFDQGSLAEILDPERVGQLGAEYNFLNELRARSAALDYQYPAGQDMFGLDISQPRVMAVVNVTPDSFSDGGRYLSPEHAISHALQLVSEGAAILDIGGESSRPGAEPVAEQDELERVIPVIEGIRRQTNILISIDTYKSGVARAALDAGANWVNDISALRHDERMINVVKEFNCPVVIMHMAGTPRTMQKNPGYDNVIGELLDFFDDRLHYLKENDVNKIIIDPGIGFGKRPEDNLAILKNLRLFKQFAYPVLVGTSRKSFIGQITGRDVDERLAGTLASVVWSALQGAALVRTHEVAPAIDALKIISGIMDS